jgi:hypothetical protein
MTKSHSRFHLPIAVLLLMGGLTSARAAEGVAAPIVGPITLSGHVKPMLEEYCFSCHNPEKQKGDLDLKAYADKPDLTANRKVWEKVAEMLDSREMPPDKKPQPSEEQRDLMLRFIDGQLSQADCSIDRNPGKVTIRRLNKAEYQNTIRDLLGVEYAPTEFPNDAVGYGFDNIGDVLSLPPMLMEKFLTAADEIVRKAIALDAVPMPWNQRIAGEKLKPESSDVYPAETGGSLGFYREGAATMSFDAPQKGEYTFRLWAYAELAGPDAPKLALRVNGKDVKVFDVTNPEKRAIYEVTTTLEPGPQKVSIAYLNNYKDLENADEKLRGDRNVFLAEMTIAGPTVMPAVSDSHRRLITRLPKPGEEHAVAVEILSAFVPRAYRRPVQPAEVERLAKFVDLSMKNGGSFLEGIQVAVQATLVSPHFLFRWELDPAALEPGSIRDLTDWEVASRLSYFLWSSMPDAELSALAAKGELRKDGNLEKQVRRMIQDPRSRAFVENFGGQWLQTRNLAEFTVDPETFPTWNESLKSAMKEETTRFFEAVMKEDRPVTTLLDADFTFLNEKLARWYGIEGVKGDEFQRVTLAADSPRGGVLTQGSVLISTSTPTRTSPVIRGKWILEQILGTPPPPPPPDVPPLAEQKAVDQSGSLRQRFEQHRSATECAGCHAKMDPLGFALENFDATGRWRDMDGKFAIDASGKLANGTAFEGPRELKQVLKGNKHFVRSFTQKMMIYALGRGLEYYDRCACDLVLLEAAKQENRFSALVIGIVTSDPFLKRKHEIAKN